MRLLPAVTLVAVGLPTVAAWAQGDTTVVTEGRELALKWCAECHLVDKGQTTAASDAVPSFYAIADHPSTTETGLKAFLMSPHKKQMPNIMLTREQIDDVVAYILSLRGQKP